MFLRNDHGLDQGGGTAALSFGRPAAVRRRTVADRIQDRFPDFELAPDLGSRIGSGQWFRGAFTCIGLCAVTLLMAPGLENPIYGSVPSALSGSEWEAARAQSIAPLAQGSTSGYHMAATSLVAPLTDTPERPIVHIPATLGSGDTLLGILRRSGVGATDAGTVVDLVGKAVTLGDIKPGTLVELTLGRRTDKSQPRPLEEMAFRARFDLSLKVDRADGALALQQIPIAIDRTPLRIRGKVGSSLYRSARAAGVPAKLVEAYIRTINTRMPVSRLGANAEWEIIAEQARAETGEVQLGGLAYAGLNQGSTRIQLVRWGAEGRTTWLDGSGRGVRTGMSTMPLNGRLTSSFGMRRHPVLGYARMHKGLDIAAPHGSPIRAAMDGVVTMAGRAGGYGNFVKLSHGSGYVTGYGHMSRIAVRNGARVSRGQIIGYVGSTGISTGPHLHYEVWQNGRAVNPRGISVTQQQQLGGEDLRQFKAKLASLLASPVRATPRNEED